MKTFEVKMAAFHAKQKEFCYLQSISMHREIHWEEGCSEYFVRIILSAYPPDSKGKKLEINFEGVRNLKLSDIDGLLALLIDIADISKDQMENINFKVMEDENNLFSFYCKSFSFEEIATK